MNNHQEEILTARDSITHAVNGLLHPESAAPRSPGQRTGEAFLGGTWLKKDTSDWWRERLDSATAQQLYWEQVFPDRKFSIETVCADEGGYVVREV